MPTVEKSDTVMIQRISRNIIDYVTSWSMMLKKALMKGISQNDTPYQFEVHFKISSQQSFVALKSV